MFLLSRPQCGWMISTGNRCHRKDGHGEEGAFCAQHAEMWERIK